MILYRIEHPHTGFGMWNTNIFGIDDVYPVPAVVLLKDCPASELPMPDSDVYREHGRQWYSAGGDWKMMNDWFSNDAIIQLLDMGFRLHKVEADEFKLLDNEYVFTKESVQSVEDFTERFYSSHIKRETFIP